MTRLERTLVWMAGASEDVLDRCGRYEQMKYAAVGATLLVPMASGFMAGFYTVYSLTASVILATVIALGWAGSLLILDRAVLITYRRGSRQVPKVLLRLFIAGVAGFIIAHAIVLFVFRDQVALKTAERRQGVIAQLEDTAQRQMKAARAEEESRHRLAIDSKQASLDQLRAERSQLVTATRSRQRERMLNNKDADIAAAQKELDEIHAKLGYEQARQIEARLAVDVAAENHRDYNDVLTRTEALHDIIHERLARGDASALVTYLLLVGLFFVLDTLPVLTKLMMPHDTYERLLQRVLQHAADRALLEVDEQWAIVQTLGRDRLALHTAAERTQMRRLLPADQVEVDTTIDESLGLT